MRCTLEEVKLKRTKLARRKKRGEKFSKKLLTNPKPIKKHIKT